MPAVPDGDKAPLKRPLETTDEFAAKKKSRWGILTSQGSWADRSPLHEAACQGRLLALRTLLAQGYHANIVTIDHVTPLHEACLSDRLACTRALIQAGANVNAATIDGVTPLVAACSAGSAGCARLLLEHGALGTSTALTAACRRGCGACVEVLVTWGVDVDHTVPHLGSALYLACLSDPAQHSPSPTPNPTPNPTHNHIPSPALSSRLAPSNTPSSAPSNTPSSAPSNTPSSAPSNTPSSAPSNTPSLSQQTLCIRTLLEQGADVQRGHGEATPLHAAAQADRAELVSVLLEFGASVNARNAQLKRPVETAPSSGLAEKILLQYEGVPRSLRQQCRHGIREHLGRSRLHLIPCLPLPNLLLRYLQHR